MYGFKKVRNEINSYEFYHPHFRKGIVEELGLITRKKVITKLKRFERYEIGKSKEQRLLPLQKRLETLLDLNRQLITINKRISAALQDKANCYAINHSKLLIICICLANNIITPEDLQITLRSYHINIEYEQEIHKYIDESNKYAKDVLKGSEFLDELFKRMLSHFGYENKYKTKTGKFRAVLQKLSAEERLPHNMPLPETAFSFRFPQTIGTSLKYMQKNELNCDAELNDLENSAPSKNNVALGDRFIAPVDRDDQSMATLPYSNK